MSNKVYKVITDKIVELIESGTNPWKKPWQDTSGGFARNHVSDKEYRGINAWILSCAAMTEGCGRFVTYKQATALGGTVPKGGHPVIYFKMLQDKDNPNKKIPMIRYYRVWSLTACGLGHLVPESTKPANVVPTSEAADALIAAYLSHGPSVSHGGNSACYQPIMDAIRMPERDKFNGMTEYYSTLYHEVVHSTGHSTRLDRLSKVTNFGSHAYSKEELIAEMGASYLRSLAGLDCDNADKNSAAYLRGWLKPLKNDVSMVVKAASAAQKAVDLIRGV